MSVELPKDAEGREIPLDTKVLYDMCGTKVSVKEFFSRTLVESQKTGWTIKAQYEGNIDYNSFKPKHMHLTPPDTWEKLEEDLDRGADALNYEACAYFGKSACDCSSCIADKGETCERVAMRDIADRIRKLRGRELMNMTPCFISEMPGEKTKALLLGFYQKAWTHDASPLIGGFPAGQIAYPVAVVLLESGDVVTVNAESVTIDSPVELFEQYAWIGGED